MISVLLLAAVPALTDCNQNGIDDAVEIAKGITADCQGNGIPDECERGGVEPLAYRMRPSSLADFAGQRHILGPGKLLTRMLEAGTMTSLLFHGPPGTGKTTLAEVIAAHTDRHFERENAAQATYTQQRARHILLRTTPQQSIQAARTRMAEIRKEIVGGQASFAQMARQNSEDGSATRGGGTSEQLREKEQVSDSSESDLGKFTNITCIHSPNKIHAVFF